MTLKILPKTELMNWMGKISDDYRLIGPTAVKDQYSFKAVNTPSQIDINYPTSILPPKKAFSPQREELIQFNYQDKQVEAQFDEAPTVLFGVHTCDLHAIDFLDTVFRRDYNDQHYAKRRENTTIVSFECLAPCTEYSFCKDMGTFSPPAEFDLHMVDIGDAYSIQVGSVKGARLIEGSKTIRSAEDKDVRQLNRIIRNKWPRFTYRLHADISELPNLLGASYKSPIWEDLGKRCLGCGACTLVCPTCYCFDMYDEADFSANSGARCRVWDSCQLNQFASVAGGHDFRPGQANRQRHRFLRKYKYQSFSPGLLGCVGCGRCSFACLVDITPVDTLNKLYQRRIASKHTRQEVIA